MKETAVANSEKTGETAKRQEFQKGTSGNPRGRPKLSEAEKDALAEIRSLAADVPEKLRALLNGPKTPATVKLKAIELILDRTYGKPDSTVRVETPDYSALDTAFALLEDRRREDVRTTRAGDSDKGAPQDRSLSREAGKAGKT